METLNPDLESAQRVYICSEDTSSIHFLARCVRLARLGGKPNSPSLERGCGTARRQRTQGGPPLASVPGAHFRAWRLQCATESAPGRRAARALTWGARAPGAPSLRRIWARSVRGAASSRGAKGSSLARFLGRAFSFGARAGSRRRPRPLSPHQHAAAGARESLKVGPSGAVGGRPPQGAAWARKGQRLVRFGWGAPRGRGPARLLGAERPAAWPLGAVGSLLRCERDGHGTTWGREAGRVPARFLL